MDQLVEIIKVVGTPTREEIEAMNPNYTEFKFPQIKAHPWARVFKSKATPEAIDLMGKLLQYTPDKRVTPMHACAHTLFDELRDPNTRLPNQRPVCLSVLVCAHNMHTCTRMHAYIHTYKRTHAHTYTATATFRLHAGRGARGGRSDAQAPAGRFLGCRRRPLRPTLLGRLVQGRARKAWMGGRGGRG